LTLTYSLSNYFQYLKTNSKLPLIEENAEATGLGSGWSGASSEVVSSGSTLRQMNSPKRHANAQQRPLSLPPKPQIKFLRKTKSLSTPNGSKQGMIFFGIISLWALNLYILSRSFIGILF
jgi:hypothetical protein